MKNFLTFLFASCLGTLLALGALIAIGALSIAKLSSFVSADEVDVSSNSVLVIDPGIIPELTDNLPRSPFELNVESIVGLRDMVRSIEKAATDDDIKGIYLDVSGLSAAPATSLALHDAIEEFAAASGKFVVAHAKYYSQGSYFIASAADELYLNPTGAVDVRGYGATLPYFKEALDKAGIKMNVFYAGDFKSAGEPFFRNGISDSNRLQTREYLDDLWDVYVDEVAENRDLSADAFRTSAQQFLVRSDSAALEYQYVDGLLYKDQVLDRLREQLGLDEDEDIVTIPIERYAQTLKTPNVLSDDEVAVVFAEGNIVDGVSEPGSIGDGKYAKLIRKLRRDDDVKAIVLRINSGGGSAMASENIWREVQLARDEGIPVVTSMGDYAASGGYYMAVATDSIYAQPNTITGSIGVVGIIPNVSELMEDKLGVHFDTVNTGEFSTSFTTVLPFSDRDEAIVQEGVQDIYETFVNRVAVGRDLPVERVKRLAKGRVYTGEDALGLGLVDALGDLDDAIATAARMAELELDDAKVSEYPKLKDPTTALVEQLTGGNEDEKDISILREVLRSELGSDYAEFERIKGYLELRGPQMVSFERVQ